MLCALLCVSVLYVNVHKTLLEATAHEDPEVVAAALQTIAYLSVGERKWCWWCCCCSLLLLVFFLLRALRVLLCVCECEQDTA